MFEGLINSFEDITPIRRAGVVAAADPSSVLIRGLEVAASLGNRVAIETGPPGAAATGLRGGEIVALAEGCVRAMVYGPTEGLALGARAWLMRDPALRPGPGWLGQVVDAFGRPLQAAAEAATPQFGGSGGSGGAGGLGPAEPGDRPATALPTALQAALPPGPIAAPLLASPPPAHLRRPLGARLSTGLAVLDTLLPVARGQRLGLFAGSGVGKSSLLAQLARGMEADCVVLVLIGERGRELGSFLRDGLGPEGRARSVTVVATADEAPLVKRRAAFTGMAIAEAFRDQGKHVLLLMDSLTRFAEAHRQIALTAGETPSLRAYPPSTAALIAGLAERAGPGTAQPAAAASLAGAEAGGPGSAGAAGLMGAGQQGDITALFTVLVAGSDMEEPVADITRGTLDGHVILDRAIAERGRFPAIDLRRSVSRALPGAASAEENRMIAQARAHIAAYEEALPMIQAGLYTVGADPTIDTARAAFPALDALIAAPSPSIEESFGLLRGALAGRVP
ncbi:MAG: flagellum-specific ATP synthase FliI [Pseudomonadota bacterium]